MVTANCIYQYRKTSQLLCIHIDRILKMFFIPNYLLTNYVFYIMMLSLPHKCTFLLPIACVDSLYCLMSWDGPLSATTAPAVIIESTLHSHNIINPGQHSLIYFFALTLELGQTCVLRKPGCTLKVAVVLDQSGASPSQLTT